MRGAGRTILTTGLLALASCASAQVTSACPSSDLCFKLNIPERTASSGSGDIFFQISAPDSYAWAALGQGTRMTGSNIFVIYSSEDGTNVTVSPRIATGYEQPNYNSDAQIELLQGSRVSNGMMVANVKCSNCDSWSGGSADFAAASGQWIYAANTDGGPENSDDQSAAIQMHGDGGSFQWNYANAKGGSSENPFEVAASFSTPSGSTRTSVTNSTPSPTGSLSSAAPLSTTSVPAYPPTANASLSPGAKAGTGTGVVVAIVLLGVAIYLYLLRRRRSGAGQPMPPELPGNEKSGLKRFLGGKWRAEVDGSSRPVELDSRTVNIIPGPPAELDATHAPR